MSQTGAGQQAVALAKAAYAACLDANQTPLAIYTPGLAGQPNSGAEAIAIQLLVNAGVIDTPINPTPMQPFEFSSSAPTPEVYLIQSAWQPGESSAATLEANLATALAAVSGI